MAHHILLSSVSLAPSSLPFVTRSVASPAPALGFAVHQDSSSSPSRKCLGEFCSGFQLFRSSSNGRARAVVVAVASQEQPKLVSTNLDPGPIMLLVENVLLPLDAMRRCSSCASAPSSSFVATTVL
ncbi:unnamed protein product [Sphagnum jensenii]|uniref:Uncharacterized protein n=1 Tax=Sphagnum jensenii TaxID=128206 RepID=A0ABP1AC34_9BRYO